MPLTGPADKCGQDHKGTARNTPATMIAKRAPVRPIEMRLQPVLKTPVAALTARSAPAPDRIIIGHSSARVPGVCDADASRRTDVCFEQYRRPI